MARGVILIWLGIGVAGSSLAGQGRPLTVRAVRGLSFGGVFPGVPLVVARTDPANSGQYDVTGTKDASVQLTFTLPVALAGPGGASLPLLFSGNDAGYSQSQTIGSQVAFDPKQVFNAVLSGNGRGSVFLGGTASPAESQAAGTYTATVTLSVSYLP